MELYYKYLNNYGDPENESWWLYSKIIKHNEDKKSCQVFEFERPIKEDYPCFIVGMAKPFIGSINSNNFKYYEDFHEPCSKEEFETELKLFMESLNTYLSFLNYQP